MTPAGNAPTEVNLLSPWRHRAAFWRALAPTFIGAALVVLGLHAPVARGAERDVGYGSGGIGADRPPGALQSLVDEAPFGATVEIPAGTYRETVTIHRSIRLRGPEARLLGSDVWTEWSALGGRWVSTATVPPMTSHGSCRLDRCDWPEQVFVDGTPLTQVASDPSTGQFAITHDRRVILADDPTGRLAEVTVRSNWIVVDGPDVTIEGLTMRHAASPAQTGGLQANTGADRLSVVGVTLSDAHGALVSFNGVADGSLTDSDLRRGGQLGIHANETDRLSIARDRIMDNDTEGFEVAWEAGGLKLANAISPHIVDNVVVGNDGPGIWCDLGCQDAVITGNRIEDNTGNGILYEISRGADVSGNTISDVGWGHSSWGWGAGILVSSSSGVTVRGNTLAWNADGIAVVSQDRDRPDVDKVHDTLVEGNTVLSDADGGFLLAWLQDWDGGIYDASSNNAGRDNSFWSDRAEPSACRFDWDGCKSTIAAFASTPGGSRSEYLTPAEHEAFLRSAELPMVAPIHPVGEPLSQRQWLIIGAMAGSVLLAGAAIVVISVRRHRGRSR